MVDRMLVRSSLAQGRETGGSAGDAEPDAPVRSTLRPPCCSCFLLAALVTLSFLIVQDPRLELVERLLSLSDRTAPEADVDIFSHGPTPAPPAWIPQAELSEPGEAMPRVGTMLKRIVVHQTVRSLADLSPEQRDWRRSWQRLGFALSTADDAAARKDIERLSDVTSDGDYLRVYDALETSVQRSDMWRYAVLWLDGGVYADVDVYALPHASQLLRCAPLPPLPLPLLHPLPLLSLLALPSLYPLSSRVVE